MKKGIIKVHNGGCKKEKTKDPMKEYRGIDKYKTTTRLSKEAHLK